MMRIAEALEAFRPFREDAIVVPGRGGRYWIDQTAHPELDVPLGDPAMGGHAGFGLGLPGPVFVALKVYPEVESSPIGRRSRWQTRSRDQVLKELRGGLGIAS